MSGIFNSVPFGSATAQIWNEEGVLLPIKQAVINASTIGDNTIVSAVTDKSIFVVSLFFLCSNSVGVRFESGAGGTALTGVMHFPAHGGVVLPFNSAGWVKTAEGALLNIELSIAGSATVSGSLQYVEI